MCVCVCVRERERERERARARERAESQKRKKQTLGASFMGEKHSENCSHKFLEGKCWENTCRYVGALLAVLLRKRGSEKVCVGGRGR